VVFFSVGFSPVSPSGGHSCVRFEFLLFGSFFEPRFAIVPSPSPGRISPDFPNASVRLVNVYRAGDDFFCFFPADLALNFFISSFPSATYPFPWRAACVPFLTVQGCFPFYFFSA